MYVFIKLNITERVLLKEILEILSHLPFFVLTFNYFYLLSLILNQYKGNYHLNSIISLF